ncbi:porin [Paraburkholderia sp. HP33-1]|uniref:porin n=1 Tax=Paraburkholderia sp. HP33-1 TaxID=2883243 RepID=UPI001F24B935|nr:porin [Paraburkholderia sp. HP33-1]
MRKTSLAIALGTLISVDATAQSSVTMYGMIDSGISYVSNQGGHSVLKFDDGVYTPNIFGLEGKEDLGGGLKAVFKLENQFQLGTGSILQPGLFGRQAYVGLESVKLGTLMLGNVYEFMFTSLTQAGNAPGVLSGGLYNFASGPFQKLAIPQNPTGYFDWSRTTGLPLSNSIRYQSPVIAGLQVGALYAPGGMPGNFSGNSAVSFGLNYTAGPFGLGAAYTDKKYPSLTGGEPFTTITNWGVGAHYAFGPLFTAADLVTVRNSLNGTAAYAAQIGASLHMSPEMAVGVSYMYMKGNAALGNDHANQIGSSLSYDLSKRTGVYVAGVYQRANSGANANINGILDPMGASTTPTQFIARVGIRTTF